MNSKNSVNTKRKTHEKGFTLVELMVTVAILSVLAVFAVNSYRHYVVKARLQEAISGLAQNQLFMEKQYNKNNGYKMSKKDNDVIKTNNLPVQRTGGIDSAGYEFTVTANDSTFLLTATPVNGQENAAGGGKECGVITVSQTGKYKSNGKSSDFKCF